MDQKACVAIVMGSKSDLETMAEGVGILKGFGIPHEVRVLSAHRTPARAAEFAEGAARRGIRVIVAAAGKAAHLAGVLASLTTIPVIGVPMHTGDLGGLDSLLSTVQMPGGIPVATVAIGKAGAKNAALLATAILALSDENLARQLGEYRQRMREEVETQDNEVCRLHGAGLARST